MKTFWDVVAMRRSVRSFLKKDVPDEAISQMLACANIAPSGSNQKNWRFIVLKEEAKRHEMRANVEARISEIVGKMDSPRAKAEFVAYGKYFTFFADAPVVIAVVMKPYDSMTARILRRYESNVAYTSTAGIQSVAAAIENMLLAAAALDLGACWMTGPMIARSALEKALEIAPPEELLALVPVGYPKTKPLPNKLK